MVTPDSDVIEGLGTLKPEAAAELRDIARSFAEGWSDAGDIIREEAERLSSNDAGYNAAHTAIQDWFALVMKAAGETVKTEDEAAEEADADPT